MQLEDESGQKQTVSSDQLAVLSAGESIQISSSNEAARFLLIAGKPLGEPVARAGPFVMNTHSELKQAFNDYQSGNF